MQFLKARPMTIRDLLKRPFLSYAQFSGRSGRPEFWLFLLTFTVVTQGSALIGYGITSLIVSDEQQERPFHHLEKNSLWHHGHENDSRVTFLIHRHDHSQGYHLHGLVDPDKFDRPDQENYELSPHEEMSSHDDLSSHDSKWRHHDDHHHLPEKVSKTLWLLGVLVLLIPLLAVSARRLHDSNHSGWWQLMVLIPVAGWLVLLVFMLLPGDEQENRFGIG